MHLQYLSVDLSTLPLGVLRKAQQSLAQAQALSDSDTSGSESEPGNDEGEQLQRSLANDKGKGRQDTKQKELPKRPHKHAYVSLHPLDDDQKRTYHTPQTHRDILEATRHAAENGRRGYHACELHPPFLRVIPDRPVDQLTNWAYTYLSPLACSWTTHPTPETEGPAVHARLWHARAGQIPHAI